MTGKQVCKVYKVYFCRAGPAATGGSMVGLPQGDSPLLLNTSYTITADIEVPQGGAEGMILTSGGASLATASIC